MLGEIWYTSRAGLDFTEHQTRFKITPQDGEKTGGPRELELRSILKKAALLVMPSMKGLSKVIFANSSVTVVTNLRPE